MIVAQIELLFLFVRHVAGELQPVVAGGVGRPAVDAAFVVETAVAEPSTVAQVVAIRHGGLCPSSLLMKKSLSNSGDAAG